MGCSLAGAGRAFLPAGLVGMRRSWQAAIAAGQTLLALKRFCHNRLQRPALPLAKNSEGTPNATTEEEARGSLMPEEALRTALVRSDVLACSWVASRLVFCS